MQPLDFAHIDKTGAVAEQEDIAPSDGFRFRAAGDRIQSAFGDHLGAGFDNSSTLNKRLDKFVFLEASQCILGVKIAILVVQSHDHTDGDVIVAHRVHNASPEHGRADHRRPDGIPHRVNDTAGAEFFVLVITDLDQFFDSEGVKLLSLPQQSRLLDKLFGQQTIASFRDDNGLGVNSLSRQIVAFFMSVFADTLVDQLHAGGDMLIRVP